MMYNGKSRHIRQRHNTVRELLSSGIITVDYVKSKDNMLDPLTKGLSREGVERISKRMGFRPRTSQHGGITQLDATIADIPLGFVPATFDEQDPDWAENRSKHRNDPVTMKNLTDKAVSKSKKSTSKASKKKFDDSVRPHLPEYSYKNIQPTTEEVNRLDLSFPKDFETSDPTTYASTSVFEKLKRTADEDQLCVGTIAEEFGDFSTITAENPHKG
ncbi:hypothetical protein CQW23_05677 [Capsicum baccatum]|uniref:Uncharacterized protein n=1 Tax=Capsicum baccatum TaxID=33114 RepID=A0A2G2XIL8_CAPBA|nr:hypothetical protein CQW23_05677 [Capsicum baccatum]